MEKMIERQPVSLHVNMFNPNLIQGSNHPAAPLFADLLGPYGEKYRMGVSEGINPNPRLTDRVDRQLLKRFRGVFNFSGYSDEALQHLLEDFQVTARGATYYVRGFYSDRYGARLEPSEEVDTSTGSMMINYMAHPRVNDVSRFEHTAHLILTSMAAEYYSGTFGNPLRSVSADVGWHLNQRFYTSDKIAQTQPHRLYGFHDQDTNKVLTFVPEALRPDEWPGGEILRSYSLPVRETDICPVRVISHHKDPSKALVKAMRAALNPKQPSESWGVIDLKQGVRDRYGMRLVAIGDDVGETKLRDILFERFGNVLEEFEPRTGGKVTVEEDSQTSHTSGQSKKFRFRRLQATIPGVGNKLEVFIQTQEEFINSEIEVGKRDPETGFPDGPAHDLVEVGRIPDVARLVLPKEIYGWDLDHDGPILKKALGMVDDIKGRFPSPVVTERGRNVDGVIQIKNYRRGVVDGANALDI